jgi:hypothetical protein
MKKKLQQQWKRRKPWCKRRRTKKEQKKKKEEKEKQKNPPQHLVWFRSIDLGSFQNGQTHLNHRWLGMEEPDPRASKHKGFTLEFENNQYNKYIYFRLRLGF